MLEKNKSQPDTDTLFKRLKKLIFFRKNHKKPQKGEISPQQPDAYQQELFKNPQIIPKTNDRALHDNGNLK